jgi:glycosyltransferase involved in cell wall biosynthesis
VTERSHANGAAAPTTATDPFVDRYPGAPRVLFVGTGDSSHEHAWIDLLASAPINARLFARHGAPPPSWGIPTYLAGARVLDDGSPSRKRLYSTIRPLRYLQGTWSRAFLGSGHRLAEDWLASIIRKWRPDVIHTFGLGAAAHFFREVRERHRLAPIGTWVLQTRGGSDFELDRFDPEQRALMEQSLRACDQLICDNHQSYHYAREMGVEASQISPLGAVPGTGGLDVDGLASRWKGPPSERRIILWPKAYETPWTRSLPVLEALRNCWNDLPPCELHLFHVCEMTRPWLRTLPEEILAHTHVHGRIPRAELLEITTSARASISTSLVDGVPNTLYEAMAAGAVPIVSPLPTITPIVDAETNVLFARNLYPGEIADALRRAMNDDALADGIAARNVERVRALSDRATIAPRVVAYYRTLAAERRAAGVSS